MASGVCFNCNGGYYIFPVFSLRHHSLGYYPQTNRLQISVREIRSATAETLGPIAFDSKGKNRFDEMDNHIQAIKKTGISIMGISGLYPVTGLASLVFSIMAFFRRPRWAAFIALPFGLLGLLMMGVMT